MSDEEIREDEGEEMIEVVTEESGEEKTESAEAAKGVDIIGDKPVRKGSAQQTPGCLYSFLLFIIGAIAGVAVFWSVSWNQLAESSDYTVLQPTLNASKGRVNKMVEAEYKRAYDAAEARNYGLACDALDVADNYLQIVEGMEAGRRAAGRATIAEITTGFKSDVPQERDDAFAKLKVLLGLPKEEPKAPGSESTAAPATDETKAEPAKADEGAPAKEEAKATTATEPAKGKDVAPAPAPSADADKAAAKGAEPPAAKAKGPEAAKNGAKGTS